MTTGTGQMVSHFRLTDKLGEGGMGVVWRAVDTRLGRDVALKTLPESVAGDEERLARFEREARALAALNHPNIAAIYGIEHPSGNDGLPMLVLEYVPGETLEERIARGPLPLEDAIGVAVQLATGLEAAHELGIVHRDLKPANLKVTPDERVKILDFGLAKVLIGGISGADIEATETALLDSPTGPTDRTRMGSFLGTVGYMSPEQARGKPVDKRTDIWAFGCVLFECLAGTTAFPGETVADKIGAILHLDPAWERLPSQTPEVIRDLLRRCLEKDPKRRMRDIGDARIELEKILLTISRPGGLATASRAARRRRMLPAAVPMALGALAAALVLWNIVGPGSFWAENPPDPPVTRVSVTVPAGLKIAGSQLSPDGRVLAGVLYAADGLPTSARLYLRRMDSFDFVPMPGTDGVVGFHFLPDGRSLVFAALESADSTRIRLARVPLDGSSPPVVLRDWDPEWMGSVALSGNELLVLAEKGRALQRVPLADRPLPPPVKIDAGNLRATFDQLVALPGGRQVLANALWYIPRGFAVGTAIIDLATGKARVLIEDGGNAKYVPGGYLLFTRGDTLLAARFDLSALKLRGEPVALMAGLKTQMSWTPAGFAAREGILAFMPGGVLGRQRRIVTFDTKGNVLPWGDDRRPFMHTPVVSREARRVAFVTVNPSALFEIWVSDLDRPALRRVVATPGADCFAPVWSPDGRRLAYTRIARNAEDGIYVLDFESGTSRRIVRAFATPEDEFQPLEWLPDGASILVRKQGAGSEAVIARADGPDDQPLLPLPIGGNVLQASLAPDGRTLAFVRNEAGRAELFVTPLVNGKTGTLTMLTSGGGAYPTWSADGRTLYYIAAGSKLMGITRDAHGSFADAAAAPAADLDKLGTIRQEAGVTALPGGRFMMLQRGDDEEEARQLNLVLGFDSELRRRLRG